LVKKYGIELSSATIRNVMADLEDMGFIEKTHTSSGRIPTDMGYKYYLTELLKVEKITQEEIENISNVYNRRVDELENILKKTSTLLSKLTNYAGIAVEPKPDNKKVSRVELVYIDEYLIMAIIVMDDRRVKTKNIHLVVNAGNTVAGLASKDIITAYQYVYTSSQTTAVHPNNDKIARQITTTEDLRAAMQEDARNHVDYNGDGNIVNVKTSDEMAEKLRAAQEAETKAIQEKTTTRTEADNANNAALNAEQDARTKNVTATNAILALNAAIAAAGAAAGAPGQALIDAVNDAMAKADAASRAAMDAINKANLVATSRNATAAETAAANTAASAWCRTPAARKSPAPSRPCSPT